MKYIKTFNENNSESYLENQSINWDLIQTAKDLALENLDEGYELEWTVDYYDQESENKWKRNRQNLVVAGVFDHNQDNVYWRENYEQDHIFDKDDLIYDFYFSRTEYGKTSYSVGEARKLTTKLNDRLIEMYPDENFEELE
jgi:hypothetical protein